MKNQWWKSLWDSEQSEHGSTGYCDISRKECDEVIENKEKRFFGIFGRQTCFQVNCQPVPQVQGPDISKVDI